MQLVMVAHAHYCLVSTLYLAMATVENRCSQLSSLSFTALLFISASVSIISGQSGECFISESELMSHAK